MGHLKVDTEYSLDPNYTPTIREWRAALRQMPKWEFYADGVYLKVSLMESNMGDIPGKTTYLISMKIMK